MRHTILDLETIPQDRDKLLSDMPPFNEADVKHGNTKDPDKIAAKVKECREKHERDYIEKAALDARSCHIKLAGVKGAETGQVIVNVFEPDADIASSIFEAFPKTGEILVTVHSTEASMLRWLSDIFQEVLSDARDRLVTYNGHEFDLPLLFRRNWILGNRTPIPFGWRRGRYWSDRFIDLREVVSFGSRDYSTGGLAGLGKMLGCTQQKTGTGAQFGELYQQDPIAAVRYCIADLNLIHEAAEKVGAIPKH